VVNVPIVDPDSEALAPATKMEGVPEMGVARAPMMADSADLPVRMDEPATVGSNVGAALPSMDGAEMSGTGMGVMGPSVTGPVVPKLDSDADIDEADMSAGMTPTVDMDTVEPFVGAEYVPF